MAVGTQWTGDSGAHWAEERIADVEGSGEAVGRKEYCSRWGTLGVPWVSSCLVAPLPLPETGREGRPEGPSTEAAMSTLGPQAPPDPALWEGWPGWWEVQASCDWGP